MSAVCLCGWSDWESFTPQGERLTVLRLQYRATDHLPRPREATEERMPHDRPAPTYSSHQRRAIEADGTVHAARSAGGGFTTACAAYPAPEAEQLKFAPSDPVTCTDCLTALGS
jgi:hypothetical protein